MSLAASSLKGALKVVEVRDLNALIRMVRLAAPTGKPLPAWTPGAHILVQVTLPNGNKDWRHYSLIDLRGEVREVGSEVADYTIAVRRDDQGRGGSQFMHQLTVGDSLSVEGPKNNFQLEIPQGKTLLLAGGIGVTPLTGMVSYCRAHGHEVELNYAVQSRSLMAFAEELQGLLGDDLNVHADDENAGKFYDAAALVQRCGANDRLYVCGPKPMLDAVLAETEKQGWEPGRVRFELFDENKVNAGDHAFEIELAESGETLTVAADQSILDCLIEHGYDPICDCKRGECGVCSTDVLDGEIDHRDYYLTQDEKDSGKVMQICVSRAKGKKLVLDL